MKLKYMIVVSLILAVFAISAVSASQDIVNDANLTANEPVDSLNESPVDEVILTKENEEAIGAEPSDFEVNIAEKVNISEMYWETESLVNISCSEDVSDVEIFLTEPGGNQSIIGGSTTIKNIRAGETVEVICYYFNSAFVRNQEPLDVVVKYNSTEIARKTITVTRDYTPIDFHPEKFSTDYQNEHSYVLSLTPCIAGNLTVYVNGVQRYNKYHTKSSGWIGGEIYVNKTEVDINTSGEYNLSAKYLTEDGRTIDFGEWAYIAGEEHVVYIRNAIDLNPANQDEIFRSCAIIEDSENITGTVTVTIDGKEVYKKTFNNNGTQLGHCLKLS